VSDGGPAFPVTQFVDDPLSLVESTHRGMSLRDWFAGQAILAVLTTNASYSAHFNTSTLAQAAYEIADAMIAERANGGAR